MRHCISTLAAAAGLFLGAAAAHADLGDQLFKLLSEDGEDFDRFGDSVAINGTTAIVGAYDNEDNGISSGSAYLFDTATGQQLFKLLPNDGAAGDYFGGSVAISGTTAIIGARRNDDFGLDSGSAYLFDTTTGQQLFKLLPDDSAGRDRFGTSVAISGTTAIVGAPEDEDNGTVSGSAYLFDITTGQQLFKLLPDDGAAGDYFGGSVAISGTTAIVGADGDHVNTVSGSAYLFDITTGQQLFKLLPDDGEATDLFGNSVAISGTTAIVGAPWDDDYGSKSGSAYLFDTTTGQQLFKLLPNDGVSKDYFGGGVAISGTTAIAGAGGDDDNGNSSGSAYLFDITTGQQIDKLTPDDGTTNDSFGVAVAISGDTAIVGATGDDDTGENSGSAYLFDAGTDPLPAALTSCSLTFGSTDNGPCDVLNLGTDDDIDQNLRSQFGFSAFERNLVEIVIEGDAGSATSMTSIETRDGSDTTNVVGKVKARNYVTNAIDDIAQYDVSFPSDDTSHSTPVNSADYVDANGEVEVRLRYVAPATFTPLGFTVGLDQVQVMVE